MGPIVSKEIDPVSVPFLEISSGWLKDVVDTALSPTRVSRFCPTPLPKELEHGVAVLSASSDTDTTNTINSKVRRKLSMPVCYDLASLRTLVTSLRDEVASRHHNETELYGVNRRLLHKLEALQAQNRQEADAAEAEIVRLQAELSTATQHSRETRERLLQCQQAGPHHKDDVQATLAKVRRQSEEAAQQLEAARSQRDEVRGELRRSEAEHLSLLSQIRDQERAIEDAITVIKRAAEAAREEECCRRAVLHWESSAFTLRRVFRRWSASAEHQKRATRLRKVCQRRRTLELLHRSFAGWRRRAHVGQRARAFLRTLVLRTCKHVLDAWRLHAQVTFLGQCKAGERVFHRVRRCFQAWRRWSWARRVSTLHYGVSVRTKYFEAWRRHTVQQSLTLSRADENRYTYHANLHFLSRIFRVWKGVHRCSCRARRAIVRHLFRRALRHSVYIWKRCLHVDLLQEKCRLRHAVRQWHRSVRITSLRSALLTRADLYAQRFLLRNVVVAWRKASATLRTRRFTCERFQRRRRHPQWMLRYAFRRLQSAALRKRRARTKHARALSQYCRRLTKLVLHTWRQEACIRRMAKCRKAIVQKGAFGQGWEALAWDNKWELSRSPLVTAFRRRSGARSLQTHFAIWSSFTFRRRRVVRFVVTHVVGAKLRARMLASAFDAWQHGTARVQKGAADACAAQCARLRDGLDARHGQIQLAQKRHDALQVRMDVLSAQLEHLAREEAECAGGYHEVLRMRVEETTQVQQRTDRIAQLQEDIDSLQAWIGAAEDPQEQRERQAAQEAACATEQEQLHRSTALLLDNARALEQTHEEALRATRTAEILLLQAQRAGDKRLQRVKEEAMRVLASIRESECKFQALKEEEASCLDALREVQSTVEDEGRQAHLQCSDGQKKEKHAECELVGLQSTVSRLKAQVEAARSLLSQKDKEAKALTFALRTKADKCGLQNPTAFSHRSNPTPSYYPDPDGTFPHYQPAHTYQASPAEIASGMATRSGFANLQKESFLGRSSRIPGYGLRTHSGQNDATLGSGSSQNDASSLGADDEDRLSSSSPFGMQAFLDKVMNVPHSSGSKSSHRSKSSSTSARDARKKVLLAVTFTLTLTLNPNPKP
jgi:hypothetical protein